MGARLEVQAFHVFLLRRPWFFPPRASAGEAVFSMWPPPCSMRGSFLSQQPFVCGESGARVSENQFVHDLDCPNAADTR